AGFVNLFTGIIFNAHDGYAMHVQTSPLGRNRRQRRLVSYGHLSSIKGADPVTVPYPEFERTALRFLSEINPADLAETDASDALDKREQELAGVDRRLSELRAA